MRIDKFLWSVRIFKTRSLAAHACKKHHVFVNGQEAKPSKEVFPGDKIQVRKDQILYQYMVLNLPDNRLGAKLVPYYLKDLTPKEAFEHKRLMQDARIYYRKKGTGRPTKKDRRALDEWLKGDNEDLSEEV